MFTADRLSEKWTVGQEAKLQGQLWNFENNVSAEDIISFHIPASQEGVYLFYNPQPNLQINWRHILFVFFLYFLAQLKKQGFYSFTAGFLDFPLKCFKNFQSLFCLQMPDKIGRQISNLKGYEIISWYLCCDFVTCWCIFLAKESTKKSMDGL